MAKNVTDFINSYNGKAIDDDGGYGVQCVDGFRVYCRWLGITPYITPNGYADGYWTSRGAHARDFTAITGSGNFKNGDVVIWARGSASHPSSHIAIYYNGQEFGENQGGNRGFCLKSTNMGDVLGALRPKALGTSTNGGTTSGTTHNGVNYAAVFDLSYYLNKYPDVKAEYGNNAFEHFKTYGMKEHRQACAGFNVDIYKANYADLQKAFGNDYPAYYAHYCTNGKAEGRNATSDINAKPATTPSALAKPKAPGAAICTASAVRVRTAPSTSTGDTGRVYKSSLPISNRTLYYQEVVSGDGYYWLKYRASNGSTHYCAYGKLDGSAVYWKIQ